MNDEQTSLFDLGASDNIPTRRLRTMHNLYGIVKGRTCGGCSNLCATGKNRVYYKCNLSKVTAGAGTDWRKKWVACGKFEDTNA